MVALVLLTTLITCSQLSQLVSNVTSVVKMNEQQKREIVEELKKSITSCPLIIQNKEKK